MELVKLSEEDYRPYQRLIRRLEHSVNPNQKSVIGKELVNEIVMQNKESILPKTAFVNSMNNPNVEAYFLKNEVGEYIGIVYMLFQDKLAHIIDFGILSEYKGKGIGTEFFNMCLDQAIKPRHCKVLTLHCPFFGAQIFWKKMGFEMIINKDYYRGNPLMRKRL